ncbi:MAG: DNA helicase RecQ [Bacteroidales bacterium]|nr:DNA helicase RecQ [Bacteroidales bacterium]
MITEHQQKSLQELLKQIFGFDKFKGTQEAIIENLLEGKDSFVIMPTGGGKSLCYQLPAFIYEGTALIVSPLIALMKNQVDAIRNFGAEKGIAHVLNSSLSKNEILEVKEDLISGRTKLLYVAPESLTKEENVEFLKSLNISFFAIDEAHCISEWGHDFRPEYRRLRPIIESVGSKPVIALTATATPKVQHDIQKNLNMLDATIFKSSFNRPNLYYEVRPKTKHVFKDIIRFIKNNTGKSGIVYCLSRKKVEELAASLQVNGIKALPYHAGLESSVRIKNQDMFLMEESDVIVATIAFGMGIDKPDVRFVIHHDMPKSLEAYYQETGRAGRDGGEGNCIAFYCYEDMQKMEKIMQSKSVSEQEIANQLLLETISYAESAHCRRIQLLHYFGEQYNEDNCHSCDNCNHPKHKFDAQEHLQLVIKTVLAVKQLLKGKQLANVLVGHSDAVIKASRFEQLPIFGKGKHEDIKVWNSIIRQALVEHLITKDIENYGLLKITEKGRAFLKEPYTVMVAKDHNYANLDEEDEEYYSTDSPKAASTADLILFSMLKDLRKEISKKENLPPFVIFQDTSLEDMAIQYPINTGELTNITGVGEGKAMKYGKPFLELIKNYVEENDIIRPNDMVVKSIVNKSGLKVDIIRGIDRKLLLEDIASAKNITFDELLTEIERIVTSGTKLDISYYINENIDNYHQEDIFDYFKEEAETDSVEEALTVLGEEEYTEEEIRLVRIKFLSELGN